MTPLKLSILACAVLSGCVNAPSLYLSHTTPDAWYALEKTDAFNDKESCAVSVRPPMYASFYRYYPFIEINDKGLFVGVKSNHGLPVGDIQIRIDDNTAWNISTSETPIVLQPSNPVGEAFEGNDYAQKAYQQTMDAMTKITSPFTAASGEKAEAILAEMLGGDELIYRSIAMNQPGSTTGKIKLDASLLKALTECKIPTPKKTEIRAL